MGEIEVVGRREHKESQGSMTPHRAKSGGRRILPSGVNVQVGGHSSRANVGKHRWLLGVWFTRRSSRQGPQRNSWIPEMTKEGDLVAGKVTSPNWMLSVSQKSHAMVLCPR
jgi:hypothetical protein